MTELCTSNIPRPRALDGTGRVLTGDDFHKHAKKLGLCERCGETRTHVRVKTTFGLSTKLQPVTIRHKDDGTYAIYKGYCLGPRCWRLSEVKTILNQDKKKKKSSRSSNYYKHKRGTSTDSHKTQDTLPIEDEEKSISLEITDSGQVEAVRSNNTTRSSNNTTTSQERAAKKRSANHKKKRDTSWDVQHHSSLDWNEVNSFSRTNNDDASSSSNSSMDDSFFRMMLQEPSFRGKQVTIHMEDEEEDQDDYHCNLLNQDYSTYPSSTTAVSSSRWSNTKNSSKQLARQGSSSEIFTINEEFDDPPLQFFEDDNDDEDVDVDDFDDWVASRSQNDVFSPKYRQAAVRAAGTTTDTKNNDSHHGRNGNDGQPKQNASKRQLLLQAVPASPAGSNSSTPSVDHVVAEAWLWSGTVQAASNQSVERAAAAAVAATLQDDTAPDLGTEYVPTGSREIGMVPPPFSSSSRRQIQLAPRPQQPMAKPCTTTTTTTTTSSRPIMDPSTTPTPKTPDHPVQKTAGTPSTVASTPSPPRSSRTQHVDKYAVHEENEETTGMRQTSRRLPSPSLSYRGTSRGPSTLSCAASSGSSSSSHRRVNSSGPVDLDNEDNDERLPSSGPVDLDEIEETETRRSGPVDLDEESSNDEQDEPLTQRGGRRQVAFSTPPHTPPRRMLLAGGASPQSAPERRHDGNSRSRPPLAQRSRSTGAAASASGGCTRRAFRQTVAASVVKETKETRTGMAFRNAPNGNVYISKLDPRGLFAGTALEVGCQIVSVNNIDCEGKGLEYVGSLVRDSRGAVTVVALRHVGGSGGVEWLLEPTARASASAAKSSSSTTNMWESRSLGCDDGSVVSEMTDPFANASTASPSSSRRNVMARSSSHSTGRSSRWVEEESIGSSAFTLTTAARGDTSASSSTSSGQLAFPVEDDAYRHAVNSGVLWLTLVGQHVRFPAPWFNGARAPHMGVSNVRNKRGEKVPQHRWAYVARDFFPSEPILDEFVPNQHSPGRLLMHLVIRDEKWRPVQDVAIGCYHPYAPALTNEEAEDCRCLWLAIRRRSGHRGGATSLIDPILLSDCRLEDVAMDSPLGRNKSVQNKKLMAVFGDEPPVQTVFVLETELVKRVRSSRERGYITDFKPITLLLLELYMETRAEL